MLDNFRRIGFFSGLALPIRLPNAQEQQVLDQLGVRPITPEERPRWDELVATHHYLKNATLVGEHLCYVAEQQGTWLALLGWSAPARHLRPRDTWIGWSHALLPTRRPLLANNARFCILADPQQLPNLASRALALCCARLSADWLARWAHPIVAVESFVDGQWFRGTAYKAAGWTRLDDTSGFARVAEDFYERHDRPKQLWVRALDAKGFRALRAATLPPAWAPFEKTPPAPRPRCRVATGRLESLLEQLPEDVPDRRDPHGRWHPWRAILGITRAGQTLRRGDGPAADRHLGRPPDPAAVPRPALSARRGPRAVGRAGREHLSTRLGRVGLAAVPTAVAPLAGPTVGSAPRSAHRH